MAVDQPDWTKATNITAGSVTITAGTINVQNTPGGKLTTALQQSQLSGSPFSVAVNSSATKTFTLDANSHAVALIVDVPANLTALSVRGVTTNNQYLNIGVAPSGSLFFAPVISAVDSQVTVSVSTGAGGGVQVWVASIDDSEVITVEPGRGIFPVQTQAALSVSTRKRIYDWSLSATGGAGDTVITQTAAANQQVVIDWICITVESNGAGISTVEATATDGLGGNLYDKLISNNGLGLGSVVQYESGPGLSIGFLVGRTVTIKCPGAAQFVNVRMSAGGYLVDGTHGG